MINRSDPQVFNILHQPAAAVREPGFASGCWAHTVSKDLDSGACTMLVRFAPGWRFEGELAGASELFVLDGSITVSGRALSCGWYGHVSEGAGSLTCSSPGGATAYVLLWPSPVIEVTEPIALSSFALPWQITILPGFPSGAMHKSLRPADATGAAHGGPGGFLRLVLTPSGWLSPREERHVGCWEENILLRGDMLMPGRGTIRAGDCLANPPGLWHGPMVTKGGALFLVNCDAPMSVEYRDHSGTGELERYLETAPWD